MLAEVKRNQSRLAPWRCVVRQCVLVISRRRAPCAPCRDWPVRLRFDVGCVLSQPQYRAFRYPNWHVSTRNGCSTFALTPSLNRSISLQIRSSRLLLSSFLRLLGRIATYCFASFAAFLDFDIACIGKRKLLLAAQQFMHPPP